MNNDLFLIDGIVEEELENNQSNDRGKIFEQLASQLILSDYCLNFDDFEFSKVDGRNDGGIDYVFIFINGHLLKDPSQLFWPKTNIELEVYIITSKHHDTFKQAPLDNIVATLTELFNFRISSNDLQLNYHEKLLKFRENLIFAFKKSSSRLSLVSFNYYYASRGNTEDIGDAITSRAEQIKQITRSYFSEAQTNFILTGSSELISLHRKRRSFSIELPFIKVLSQGERYVLLTKISDYYNFLIDENHKLKRFLFDSNVRDYMGLNRVNEDIKNTLEDDTSPEFWWLNNGVTIIASAATVIGDCITIEDVQIVNGLQTSESIYNYFKNKAEKNEIETRSVLVKIIVTTDADIKDSIIKATNNQTPVELAALHASDKIQKDIEDSLLKNGYYYERRTNYYRNQGIDLQLIIQPLYIASGFIALVHKNPNRADKLKNRFMRNEADYNNVFNNTHNLLIWFKIAKILKFIDFNLETVRQSKSYTEGFLKKWRYIIGLLLIAKHYGTYNYSTNNVIDFEIDSLSNSKFNKIWEFLKEETLSRINSKRLGEASIKNLVKRFSEVFNISNPEGILNRKSGISYRISKKFLSEDFIITVDNLLPKQPWKPGIDKEIIKKLGCTRSEYFNATKILIERGIRFNQKDGLVYDPDGNIIMIDEDRVDRDTMQLKI